MPTSTLRAVLLLLVLASVALACGDDGDEAPATCEALLESAEAPESLRLTVDGTRFRDHLGREVLLRGVNAGGRSKYAPFLPFPFAESGVAGQETAPPFDEALATYFDRVAEWGHDVVRLPFTWEAVEPVRGSYDAAFLDRYEAMIAAAGARGIRVVVDLHQDVFAQAHCGDGFPPWAVGDPEAAPDDDCRRWFEGYTTDPNVASDFDRFWANEDGLMDAFEAMWRQVATRAWAHDNVIGFEVINEPHRGSGDEVAWAEGTLAPFYARLAGVIREVAPGAPVFVDATGFDAVTAETATVRPDAEDIVFAPHYYDALALLSGSAPADGDAVTPLERWRAVGDAWDAPVLVGEFGVRPDANGAAGWARANFDALDTHLLHGTFWEYSATTDTWNGEGMSVVDGAGNELATAPELVRAYPLAIAGRVTSFTFDRETLTGTLAFESDAGGVSELRVPSRLYGGEVAATVSSGCAALAPDGETLRIGTLDGGPLTVTFSPEP